MDIIREIIAFQSQQISNDELNRLLDYIGRLKNTKAKKEAVKVLYSTIDLDANQFQSIVDHISIRKVSEILRFAQKQARHYTYRSTQQVVLENKPVKSSRTIWLTLFIVLVVVTSAFLVPQISELFL